MPDSETISTACDICTQPAPDATICSSCVAQLVTELRRLPWLLGQLHITLTRQSRTGERNGGRSAERPLPYDHTASVDLETLHATLRVWCDEIATRRGIPVPSGVTAALGRWLLLWPSEIAGHPDAAQLHDELMGALRAAERTIDRRPDLKFVGPCDGNGASVLAEKYPQGCGEDLYAPVNAHRVICRVTDCYGVYDVEPRRAWLLEQAADQLRTARQLSDELGWIAGVHVSSKLIGMWATRGTTTLGKLHTYLPHPTDPRGAQRFRVGEVIDYARAMAQETQAKRVKAKVAA